MSHSSYIRRERRVGMILPEWRYVCECGATDKGPTRASATARAKAHELRPDKYPHPPPT